MKRRLILMRHAKSSWSAAASDHERPLNDRGRQDAPRVARELGRRGWEPDQVLSSDAARARETWERMTAVLGPRTVSFSRALYSHAEDAFEEEVGLTADEIGTLLVIGHNPGWEALGHRLTGQDVRFTTANAALLEGAGPTWATALSRPWRLVDVLRPKEIP